MNTRCGNPVAGVCAASILPIRRSGSTSPAFSLFELVIVIAIIGLISAIVIPRFSGSLARRQVEAAALRIVTDLEMAQSRAYNRSTTQLVVFNVSSSSYEIVGASDLNRSSRPYIVRLAASPYSAMLKIVNFNNGATAAFDAFGQPQYGGTIIVAVGTEQRTIVVDPSSGRAQAQ